MAAPPITQRHLPHFHRRAPMKEACRAATTANITISTALNNGDTLDGITLATGDRVLVKDQSTGSQNGIYEVGASPARAYDESSDDPGFGYLVFVREGSVNGGTLWKNTNTSAPTIGTTALTFTQFSGMSDPMTTRGDIIIRNPSNVTARLGVGSSGQVLSSDGTDVSWQTPASGSGTLTTVKDEGTNLSTAVVSLDFTGAGVTATGTTAVTVNIPGGGGGGSTSFLGYNTVGGSWETLTGSRHYCKKFTMSAAGWVNVQVHLRPSTDNVTALIGEIDADNSNAPGVLISAFGGMNTYLSNSSSMPGAGRWVGLGTHYIDASGDYWACFAANGTLFDVAYDGSGSDQYFTANQFIATGAYPSAWSITTGSRKYSIRIAVLT